MGLSELKKFSLRTQLSGEEVIAFVQDAFRDGRLQANYPLLNTRVFSGGTNFCPNSDFSWSHLASTVAGTSPSDTSDDNKRCYRVFRQAVGADISTTGLRIAGAGSGEESVGHIPIWDKTLGVAVIGADDVANNYDIAFKFENNWLVPAKTWYVRVSCATMTSVTPPDGLKLYAGFWIDDGTTQGWVQESAFSLTVERLDVPDPAGSEYEYKVIARTDSGVEVESATESVSNVGTLGIDNRLRVAFYGASGYLEFETYRRDKTTGRVDLIDFQRNSTNLSVVDQGQSIRQVDSFPTGDGSDTRAYAELNIEALPIDQQKTFNNFTIRIPNFDTASVVSEGTYLRIGLTSDVPCAIDRQIALDTVWASESFNAWTPSPNDGYGSLPSVSVTTGVSTGGNTTPFPPRVNSGNTCVFEKHDLLFDLEGNNYGILKDVEVGTEIDNGSGKTLVSYFLDGQVSQYYRVRFSHGLVLNCTESHRFIRSLQDGTGIQVRYLKEGDLLLGVKDRKHTQVRVEEIELVQRPLRVRATKVLKSSDTLYYAVGSGEEGLYVYSHNLKTEEEQF